MHRSPPLPNFLVIGAMKAGTTSLYHYLRAHPQVFMPKLKEVDFFTAELNWRRGWDWYRRQFADAPSTAVAIGEASTSYTKFPRYEGVAGRIAAALPDVKLIYVVRDPVQRIRSHYQHNVALGEERAPIDVAVRQNRAYLDYSRYATQLEQFLAYFPRTSIFVTTSDALRIQRRDTVEAILAFLGADTTLPLPTLDQEYYKTEERPAYGRRVAFVRNTLRRLFPERVGLWRGAFVPSSIKRMLGTAPPPKPSQVVSEATKAWIHHELRDEVERLRTFLPQSFDGWGIA